MRESAPTRPAQQADTMHSVMILIHRLYDNGYIMILPELDVLKQMADIASAIHQKLVQADLEKNRKLGKARSKKEKRSERANLKKKELALQAWIEARWTVRPMIFSIRRFPNMYFTRSLTSNMGNLGLGIGSWQLRMQKQV